MIKTDKAPAPAGHYSQGVQASGFLFVSGQLPITPEGCKLIDAPIDEQVTQCLANIEAIVETAGGSKHSISKINIYLADMNLWDQVDKVYAPFFGDHKPARAVVPASPLHFGFLVEIDATAVIPSE